VQLRATILLLFIMRIVHKVHINIKIYEVHNAVMKQLMSVCAKWCDSDNSSVPSLISNNSNKTLAWLRISPSVLNLKYEFIK
jgi:hypothetical protein